MPPRYQLDSYQRELTAPVRRASDDPASPWVELGDTVLYPEGGGQPEDRGWVDGIPVVHLERCGEGPVVRHYLERPLTVTGPVLVCLDWARRFDHMQQHTAQHLLSAVAADRFGWQTTAFHLGSERADVELAVTTLDDAALERLEEAVMEEVRRARPVRVEWVEVDELERLAVRSRGLPAGHRGAVRLVEIESIDRSTCGGTHLASTAEIEALHLLGTEAMRGGTRLHWVAGRRVRRRLAAHEDRAAGLRRLLDCATEEQVGVLRARLEQLDAGRRRERQLEEALAASLAKELALRPGPLVERHLELGDVGFLQQVGRAFLATRQDAVLLLTAAVPRGLAFVVATGEASGIAPGVAGGGVAERLGGRGGGRGPLFQGVAEGEAEGRRSVAVRWLAAQLSGAAAD